MSRRNFKRVMTAYLVAKYALHTAAAAAIAGRVPSKAIAARDSTPVLEMLLLLVRRLHPRETARLAEESAQRRVASI